MADQTTAESMTDQMFAQANQNNGMDADQITDHMFNKANQYQEAHKTYMSRLRDSVSTIAADAQFAGNTALHYLDQDGPARWGSLPFHQALKEFTHINDKDDEITQALKGANQYLLRPFAIAGDLPFAGMNFVGEVLQDTGQFAQQAARRDISNLDDYERQHPSELLHLGNLPTRAFDTFLGGYGEIAGAMGSGQYFGEHPAGLDMRNHEQLLHDMASAKAKGAIGQGEDAYFGTRPLTPEELEARINAGKASGEPPVIPKGLNNNLDELARQTNPALFNEYEEKLNYHDELAQRLEELQTNFEEDHIPGFSEKSPKLEATEEMFKKNYNRLQELDEQIKQSYEHAKSLLPEEDIKTPEEEYPPTGSRKAPERQTEEEASQPHPAKKTSVEAPEGSIVKEVEKMMLKAGRSQDEATAAGRLVEAHYNSRASRFYGVLGNANDLFDKDFPEIIRGGKKGRVSAANLKKVLNQYGGVQGAYGLAHVSVEEASRRVDNLIDAINAEEKGENPDLIRLKTGWFRNPFDKKWRFEISDKDSKLKISPDSTIGDNIKGPQTILDRLPETNVSGGWFHSEPLENIIEHEELFKHYPEARNIQVIKQAHWLDFSKSIQGLFDPNRNQITVTPHAVNPHSTLLHEIQHWIQHKEGHAVGSNVDQVIKDMSPDLRDRLKGEIADVFDQQAHGAKLSQYLLQSLKNEPLFEKMRVQRKTSLDHFHNDRKDKWRQLYPEADAYFDSLKNKYFGEGFDYFNAPPIQAKLYESFRDATLYDLDTSMDDLVKKQNILEQKARENADKIISTTDPKELANVFPEDIKHRLYRAVAGEIEARDTQKRQALTEEERISTPSYETGDYRPEEVSTFYQDNPIFHSTIDTSMRKISMKDGTAKQWLAQIRKRGAHPEEMKYTGLKEWLESFGNEKVSRFKIQNFLDAHKLDINEIHRGSLVSEDDIKQRAEELFKRASEKKAGEPLLKEFQNYVHFLDEAKGDLEAEALNTLAQKEYENHPSSDFEDNWDHLSDKEKDNWYQRAKEKYGKKTRYRSWADLTSGKDYKELTISLNDSRISPFEKSHWPEPNVIAHVRFDTLKDANGQKVLRIQELQSDWHQGGNKHGYMSSEDIRRRHALNFSIPSLQRRFDELNYQAKNLYKEYERSKTKEDEIKYREADNKRVQASEELRQAQNEFNSLNKVSLAFPDVPFKTNWSMLAMKRMMRYAVENGYDKIAWDTGKTNAERMRGSKESGQTEFYDKHLPNAMQKYVKQWGAKVSDETIDLGGDKYVSGEPREVFHGPTYTREQLETIYNNMSPYNVETRNLRPQMEHILNLIERGHPVQEALDRVTDNRLAAYLKGTKTINTYHKVKNELPVHSVDITSQMRSGALDSQSLYQTKRGSLTLGEGAGGKNVIRLFTNSANSSTIFHELGHQWFEEMLQDAKHPNAPVELLQDVQTVKDWLGMEDDIPSRDQHEMFARGFERYLREGVAPSEGLKGVFEQLKAWLVRIYKTIADLNVPMTDEVRSVFDRLLASDKTKPIEEAGVEAPKDTPLQETGEELSQAKSKPFQRLQPIKGTGKKQVRGLSARAKEEAIEEGMTEDFGELPTYARLDMKEQAKLASQFISSNENEAYQVAMGNKKAPTGVTPEAIWVGMKNKALADRDGQMMLDLAHSKLAKDITTAAQRLRSLREDVKQELHDDEISGVSTPIPNVVKGIKQVESDRDEYFQKNKVGKRQLTPQEAQQLTDLGDNVAKKFRDMMNAERQQVDNWKNGGKQGPMPIDDNTRTAYGKAKLDYRDFLQSLKPNSQSWFGKADHAIGNALGIFKVAETGIFHFSAMGVQGWGMLSNKYAYKGFTDMFKYFANEENYRNLEGWIVAHPDYAIAKKAKLGLTNISDDLTGREEGIQSNILEKLNKYAVDKTGAPEILNIVKGSSRAFTGYLNYLRFNRYVQLLNAARAHGEVIELGGRIPEELAEVVNNFTGRANLGWADSLAKSSVILNNIFYAPRKMVATFQMFNPYNILKYQSWTAKKAAMSQLTGSLAVTGGIMTLAAACGADVDYDPRSAHFGKIGIGGEWFDMTGGNATYLRLVARIITSTRINGNGRKESLDGYGYKAPTRMDEVQRFVRGKFAPIASIMADALYGSDPTGRPFDAPREVMEKAEPIWLNNYLNFFWNNPDTSVALVPSLSVMLGIGMESPTPNPTRMGMDAFGDPSDTYFGTIDRGYAREQDNPMFQAYHELGKKPTFPGQTINGVQLNDDQYHDYILLSGKTLKQVLGPLLSNPEWKNIPRPMRSKLIDNFTKASRKQAASILIMQPGNKDLRDQIIKQKSPLYDPQTTEDTIQNLDATQ